MSNGATTRMLARAALSRSARPGTARRQFRAVLGACGAGRAVPLRPPAGARSSALTLPEYTDEVWHGYLPDARPGPALRLSRARSVRSARRATASTTTSCCSIPMRGTLVGALAAGTTRTSAIGIGSPRGDLTFDRRDSAPLHAEVPAGRHRASPGATTAAARRPGRDDHLRDCTCAAITDAPSRSAERTLRGTFAGSRPARRDRRICSELGITAVELLPVQLSSTTRTWSSAGCANYWGYNTIGFFAPEPRYLARGQLGEFKRWSRPCTRPASRSFSTWSTTTPPKAISSARRSASAASTTPPITGSSRTMPRYYVDYHRLRQHAQPQPSAGAAAGAWIRCAIGVEDARRRLPLRSRHDARARGRTASTAALRLPRCHRPGPGARARQADRRAVGPRPGRLSARRLPAGLVGMERPLPRYRAALLARRRRASLGELARASPARATSSTAAARRPRRASISSPPTTGSRCADLVSYNDKHNEANQREQPGRRTPTTTAGTAAPRARPTIPAILELRAGRGAICWRRLLLLPGRADAAGRRRDRAQRQSGNNNAYCQDNEISWIDWSAVAEPDATISRLHRQADRLRRAASGAAPARTSSTARRSPATGIKDITWLRPDGEEMTEAADWALTRCALPRRHAAQGRRGHRSMIADQRRIDGSTRTFVLPAIGQHQRAGSPWSTPSMPVASPAPERPASAPARRSRCRRRSLIVLAGIATRRRRR